MSENQARFSRDDDVYDHEHEASEAVTAGRSGRRRQPVADWGVGDDVFEQMPRRRFSRATEGPPRERRFASHEGAERRTEEPAGEATARRSAEDDLPRHGAERRPADDDLPPQDAERRPTGDAEPPRGGAADGRRTLVIGRPEDVPSEIAAVTADRDLGDDDEPPAAEALAARGERRTVRIAGRPEGSLEAARAHREHGRRRPPRTAHERIGARPDRLAMWAFALGMLLILIALLTAG